MQRRMGQFRAFGTALRIAMECGTTSSAASAPRKAHRYSPQASAPRFPRWRADHRASHGQL